MKEPRWLHTGIAIVYLSSCVCSASAQKLDVSVLYRQDSDVNYFAVIPGYTSQAASDSSPNCTLDPNPADCTPSTAANGLLSERGDVAYNVVGTTLSLLLPDGRVALVNCVNKYSPKGNYINRRNCGMPLVDHVQAEFSGKTAKLKWSAGPDGKAESEIYKIVAFLDKELVAKR